MFLFFKPYLDFAKKVLLVVIVFFAVIALFSHFISKDKIALTSSNHTDPILENRKEIYKVINDKELNKTTLADLKFKSVASSIMILYSWTMSRIHITYHLSLLISFIVDVILLYI